MYVYFTSTSSGVTGWPLKRGIRRTRQAGDDIQIRVADHAEADQVEAGGDVGFASELASDARSIPIGDEVGVDAVLSAGNVVLDCVVNGVLGGGRGADDEVVVVQVELGSGGDGEGIEGAGGFGGAARTNGRGAFKCEAVLADVVRGERCARGDGGVAAAVEVVEVGDCRRIECRRRC